MEEYIKYRGKGEHSVSELEKIVEQCNEKIHLLITSKDNILLNEGLKDKLKFASVTKYIHNKKNQDECSGFCDGYDAGISDAKLLLNEKI